MQQQLMDHYSSCFSMIGGSGLYLPLVLLLIEQRYQYIRYYFIFSIEIGPKRMDCTNFVAADRVERHFVQPQV